MARPCWSLTEVRRLAADGRIVLTHAAAEYFATRSESVVWVREALQNLKLVNFSHSLRLAQDMSDVYGVNIDDCGWYLKLTLTEDGSGSVVLVVSCHPVKYPLKTRDGTIYP